MLAEKHHPKKFCAGPKVQFGAPCVLFNTGALFLHLPITKHKAWDFLLDNTGINACDIQYFLNVMHLHSLQHTPIVHEDSIGCSRYLSVSKTAAGEHLPEH